MGLKFWGLSLLVLVATVLWLTFGDRIKLNRKKKPVEKRQPISHTRRLRELPEYQGLLGKYRKIVLACLVLVGATWLGSVVLVGRPVKTDVVYPQVYNRDIVLCLDVSGSMHEVVAESLDTFASLTKGFDGQRIALSLFNSSSVTMFPLTNDYELASDLLGDFARRARSDKERLGFLLDGTMEGSGASLIADGLVSCLQRFDQLESERSRSVILITDNYASKGIVEWDQAIDLAKNLKIRLYGINPYDSTIATSRYIPEQIRSFRQGTIDTGGDYYKIDDTMAVGAIIEKINQQDAALSQGLPQLMVVDRPLVLIIIITVLVIAYLALAWRFRL